MFTLTIEQHQAINRLFESLTPSDREATKKVTLESFDEPTDFVRVTFDAGWGTTSFDIDEEGNSAQVVFGSSEIAC